MAQGKMAGSPFHIEYALRGSVCEYRLDDKTCGNRKSQFFMHFCDRAFCKRLEEAEARKKASEEKAKEQQKKAVPTPAKPAPSNRRYKDVSPSVKRGTVLYVTSKARSNYNHYACCKTTTENQDVYIQIFEDEKMKHPKGTTIVYAQRCAKCGRVYVSEGVKEYLKNKIKGFVKAEFLVDE